MANWHVTDRTSLSLKNYAFRSVIKNAVQATNENLIDPLLKEYNILGEFEGTYIVRAIEFRMENYFCQQRCTPTDRYTWNNISNISSPDVGDDVIIVKDSVNFKIRGTFGKYLIFIIKY